MTGLVGVEGKECLGGLGQFLGGKFAISIAIEGHEQGTKTTTTARAIRLGHGLRRWLNGTFGSRCRGRPSRSRLRPALALHAALDRLADFEITPLLHPRLRNGSRGRGIILAPGIIHRLFPLSFPAFSPTHATTTLASFAATFSGRLLRGIKVRVRAGHGGPDLGQIGLEPLLQIRRDLRLRRSQVIPFREVFGEVEEPSLSRLVEMQQFVVAQEDGRMRGIPW